MKLGGGLRLCGILTHRLEVASTVMMYRDIDAVDGIIRNVDYNLRRGGVSDGTV